MRLVQLTPGTGNFYCGSCIRDNTLVTALRREGHDVLLAPMYLPHFVDEESATQDEPLFFGGVNVYLQQKSGFFRHAPRWIDRFFDSPAVLRQAASRSSMTSARDLGELTLSMLQGADGRQAKELHKLVTWLASLEPRPDAVVLSNVLLTGLAAGIVREAGIPVVCTLQGEDSFLDSLPEPHRGECWKTLAACSRHVGLFIAVSRYYRDVMASRLRLPAGRIQVVHNGIRLDGFSPAPSPPSTPTVGFLARLCPGKGLGTLVDAFIRMAERGRVKDARLRIAGSQTPADIPFVTELQERLAARGLAGRVEWLPNVDLPAKRDFLRSLSVLSVPAMYGESFGLYVIEAMAAGVPVVQPRHGGFPEIIDATGGGLLYEPGAPDALPAALESLLLHPARAAELGRRGHDALPGRFDSATMARHFTAACANFLEPLHT